MMKTNRWIMATMLMAMGFAVQFTNGDDVAMRIYPDIHVKGGNINLKRAKELDPSVTDLTVENAGELIDKAGGVTVRVRATVQQKFTEMLMKQDVKIQRTGVSEAAYVERTNDGNGTQVPTNNGGGNSGGNAGGDNGGGNNGGEDGDMF